jgi:carbonic anhydrase
LILISPPRAAARARPEALLDCASATAGRSPPDTAPTPARPAGAAVPYRVTSRTHSAERLREPAANLGGTTTLTCTCCGPRRFDRRRLLGLAGAAGLAALRPGSARAASGEYEAMVLACIDPRLQEPVHDYLKKRGLTGKYSQFTIAGAAIAVVAPKFAAWHRTFWDNLALSNELHHIKRIIAIDHRDCGAAKLAYGEKSVATPDAETATHRRALTEFRGAVAHRHPHLQIETGLMALDGSIQIFG